MVRICVAGGESIAFLRRHGATAGDIVDGDVLGADWVIHVASPRGEAVAEFCGEVARLLRDLASLAGELGAAGEAFIGARARCCGSTAPIR